MIKIDNRVYDVLKWSAMLFLPALATLIATICATWHIPYGQQAAETVIALDAFLGAVLGISNIHYIKENKEGNTDES